MQVEEARRLTQLEKENVRLSPKVSPKSWRLLAEAELGQAMFKELVVPRGATSVATHIRCGRWMIGCLPRREVWTVNPD
jgi:hypothetical protein